MLRAALYVHCFISIPSFSLVPNLMSRGFVQLRAVQACSLGTVGRATEPQCVAG